MYKNESIEIKPGMNGYRVDYDYRIPSKDKDLSYDYISEEFYFSTWDEVVKFVTDKKLETPPAKINQ